MTKEKSGYRKKTVWQGPPSFNFKAKHFNRLRFVKRKSPVGFIHLCESRSGRWNIQIM